MPHNELDTLYRPRRVPWIPIVLGVVVAIGIGLAILRREDAGTARSSDPAEDGAPRAATGAPAASVTAFPTGRDRPSAPRAPAAPQRPPYPAAALDAALAEIRALERDDRLLEARDRLLALVEDPRSLGARQGEVESRLAHANILLVTTPRQFPGKIEYTIQRGDSLSRIAARFNCPAELIQRSNNIANAALIRPGDVLRILDRPAFAIQIDKRGNTLLLTLGGRFFKRYAVGTGTYGRTPVGTFIVRDKISQPPWWRPDGRVLPFGDPENILGTRWLAIEATGDTPRVGGYGIHGTWDESTIGKQSSAGCVRMRNADVEELAMLVPRGTPVTIVEGP